MSKILYLPHRLPFPPNKGDKIRAFNVLKHLSIKHQLFVGTFVDDPADYEHIKKLAAYCVDSCVVKQNKLSRRIASAKGLLNAKPLGLVYYESPKLQAWVDQTVEQQKIDTILTFSSTMSQFIDHERFAKLHRVADFCDIDSDKWEQYSKKASWPMSAVFSREARTLLEYERAIASRFNSTLFVNESESELFKKLAPESAQRIDYFDQCVDAGYFSPAASFAALPHTKDEPIFCFTGAMDYRANVDAVLWFVQEVWPAVRKQLLNAKFYIVGTNPAAVIVDLNNVPGVVVTGRVADVRPYIAASKATVAPLRIARGTQTKVLEAMAMAKAIVCSTAAAEGLAESAKACLLIRDDASGFAQCLIALAAQNGSNERAREIVLRDYSWMSQLRKLDIKLAR